jgi:hypothetical protein
VSAQPERSGPRRSLRVLVLTNHLMHFGGSEVIALEVAEWFRDRGDEVTIGANRAGPPLTDCLDGIELTLEVDAIDLARFDLVWCQHDMLAFVPVKTVRAAARRPPSIALAGLSPSHPFEVVDGVRARGLGAIVHANSTKTAAAIEAQTFGLARRRRIVVFHNAAPPAFFTDTGPVTATGPLRTLLVISNHPPKELIDALATLAARGIEVRMIGAGRDPRRVVPEDLAGADAVVTIGKSVVYALAQRRPVYLYDQFGGDGWLVPAIWRTNLFHNFAGQPQRRRISADELVAEITDGFDPARTALPDVLSYVDERFHLDHHLRALRRRVGPLATVRRSLRWRASLARPSFRAHLQVMNRRGVVQRRYYLGFTRSEPKKVGVVRKFWWSNADALSLTRDPSAAPDDE